MAEMSTVRHGDVITLHDEQRAHGILDLPLLRQAELLGGQRPLEEHQSGEGVVVRSAAGEFVHLFRRG